jgi:hypothetical protein
MKWPWQKSDEAKPVGSKGNVDPGTSPRARPAANIKGGTRAAPGKKRKARK